MDLGNTPLATKASPGDNRNVSFDQNGQAAPCFHLGALMFAPFLNKLYGAGLDFIRQWLTAILLGCHNIEQGKELNYTSLGMVLGPVTKTLGLQRTSLKKAASRENIRRVLQFNAGLLKVNQQHDFYYDPHTKH